MRGTVAFNKTVIGHKHVIKNIPCEDSSNSYSDEFGLYDIAIVADGHGDPSCFRSKNGSKLAVDTAMLCLREFACCWCRELGSFRSSMQSQRERAAMIKALTDTIISKWYEAIHKDLSDAPLTEEELLSAGSMAEAYRRGERVEHIYGTTLMAALRIVNYLILIHQGDGRCDVFYADGTVDQPIPWDDRCQENVTTSMCDEDVAVSIRNCVIDLSEQAVVACYLGSDGIEDSYRGNDNINQDGTHFFYRELTCELAELKFRSFDELLENKLSELSREGSADDMSVAGIVCPLEIDALLPAFRRSVRNYRLAEDRAVYEEKLASMERKYSVLSKRLKETQMAYEDKAKDRQHLVERMQKIKERGAVVKQAIDKKRAEADDTPERSKIGDFVMSLFNDDGDIKRLEKEFATLKNEYKTLAEDLAKLDADNEELKQRYEKCSTEFCEYDALYKEIYNKVEKINAEINGVTDSVDVPEVTEEPALEEETDFEEKEELAPEEETVFEEKEELAPEEETVFEEKAELAPEEETVFEEKEEFAPEEEEVTASEEKAELAPEKDEVTAFEEKEELAPEEEEVTASEEKVELAPEEKKEFVTEEKQESKEEIYDLDEWE